MLASASLCCDIVFAKLFVNLTSVVHFDCMLFKNKQDVAES